MNTQQPVTLYGFILAAVVLIGLIVLTALGDVAADVAVPIIAGVGLGGLGAGAGIAHPRTGGATETTGDVGFTDPTV